MVINILGDSKAISIDIQANAENVRTEAEASAGAVKIKAAGDAEARQLCNLAALFIVAHLS